MRLHATSWFKGWKITLRSTEFQCQDGSTRFASSALLEPAASEQDNSPSSVVHMDESFTTSAEANTDALDRAKRQIFASCGTPDSDEDGNFACDTEDLAGQESLSELGTRFEISFDGKRYAYRQYRYDRFEDALRYARADRLKNSFLPNDAFTPQWELPYSPSNDERLGMQALGVTFVNGRFSFDGVGYDRLADAISYAARFHVRSS